MKPLIKWAGGKGREIKNIKEIIPEFNRYIEPFFGGGALFFELEPKKAVINDLSEDLINFYKTLKDETSREKLRENLNLYSENWGKIKDFVNLFKDNLLKIYFQFKEDNIDKEILNIELKKELGNKIDQFNGLFKDSFCINSNDLFNEILKNIFSKLVRIKNIEEHNEKNFTNEEMLDHIETSFRSGFYNHFRNILNNSKLGIKEIEKEKHIATYYFIREFCYGSMFRFNEDGGFNIPYGGTSYNKKNFKRKVDLLFSKEVKELLANTQIHNLDFEELLKKINPTKEDFIFLDPPYHTEFSEYDQNAFDKEDQRRLANLLLKLDSKFILLIKNRHFIENLYKGKKGIKITSFKKTYTYNARGRNNREARHLIIYNF